MTTTEEDSMWCKDVTFTDLGLKEEVLKGLEAHGFVHPTPIQAELIPVFLQGKDALGRARTGTGKTAAFGLPLLHLCDENVKGQALVLAPTRELARQIASELREMAKHTKLGIVDVIGGASSKEQKDALQKHGHIIVGTPGRVQDLMKRRVIQTKHIRFAILDEVDRMLDIGFRDAIRAILKACPNERQTVFVSATIDEQIEKLSKQFMKDDAEEISTVSGSLTVAQVDQYYVTVEPWDKRRMLRHILKIEKPEACVIFCRTKNTVARVAKDLQNRGFAARAMHGDMNQDRRNKVMKALRDERVEILVASDLAARGLDVDHITHVINYDLPDDPEVYIHRIGRTARAGRQGRAFTLVCPDQGQLLLQVEKLAAALLEKHEFENFEPGPVPQDIQQERERQANIGKPKEPVDVIADASEEELKHMFPGGKVPTGKTFNKGRAPRRR